MIRIKDLKKTYNGKAALENVNLEIPRGQIIGLFGENGAGKTTLMKCIFHYVSYSGDITLDNEPISTKNIAKLSFATGEHSFFPNLTPAAHRDFYKEHFDTFSNKRFKGLMEFFELPMNKMVRSFSTGQKNQFEVILALSQGADYIFMDEPFSGNDIFNREDFYKVLLGILEPHETIVLSTHLIDEVSNFLDRIVLIQDKTIGADISAEELDESGLSLTEFMKKTHHYQNDRVSRALSMLTGEEEL